MAVIAGVESAIKIHIQRGDDVNARDAGGLTPLMLAASRNKPAICALLLSSGADPKLKDPNGKDAQAHARQAGADAALVEFQAAIDSTKPELASPPTLCLEPKAGPDLLKISVIEPPIQPNHDRSHLHLTISATLDDFAGLPVISAPVTPNQSAIESSIDSDAEQASMELSDWEPEVDPVHGADDPILAQGAATVQISITNHTPVDSSSDWDDLDVYLPLTSAPLRRANDAEAKATLRLLLLRALREGSVPDLAVVDMAINEDHSENEEAEALLRMVINDLGAETDERVEFLNGSDLLEAITSAKETQEEDELISDAMAFIDTHESNRNDPLQHYQREFQREKLISADEEIILSKSMEHSIAKAMDALATWPLGIAHVISCSELVKSGAKPIQWFTSGTRDDAPEEGIEIDSADAIADIAGDDEPEFDSELDRKMQPPELESVDLFERISALSKLVSANSPRGNDFDVKEVRKTLASLSLKNSLLLGLLDLCGDDNSAEAKLFSSAMVGYRQARDRMAIANLKLVASIAKKFFYTGLPMEDLIQDGNIGLLRAVDKYDWRKGFRFSTMATWWIRQSIHRAVSDTSRTIRLPVHIYDVVQKIIRVTENFEQVNGRPPSKIEVAEIMSLPVNKAAALMRISHAPESIDNETIDELITSCSVDDYSSPDPFEVVAAADLSRVINVYLSELSRQHERIIRLRFGIGESDSLTLEEIGTLHGITRERIRQIESKIMRLLKNPHRLEKLRGMLFGNIPMSPAARAVESHALGDDLETEISESLASTKAKEPIVPIHADQKTPARAQIRRGSTFHRFMTEALELGVEVAMDRESTSGTTWVELKGRPDDRHRRLIRKLLAIGFKHWPGKGYWR